jgi:hypothetical protein
VSPWDFVCWASDVTCSRALRWSLVLLIPLTLGWKVVAAQRAPYQLKDRMIVFLTRHHLQVEVTDRMIVSDMPLINATAGTCRMQIVEASPDGSNRDVIRDLAKASDELFVVFRGEIYREQPTWLTVSHALWSRYLRQLGFSSSAMPIIAVAATTSCNARRLPWAELTDFHSLEGFRGNQRPGERERISKIEISLSTM